MDFRREAWRKLYIRENLEHRGWPLLARGIRDYLIRHARDDGTLLARTTEPEDDLAASLGPRPDEVGPTILAIQLLLADGFLVHDKRTKRLSMARFEEAQERSTSTERVRRYRSKLAELAEPETLRNVPEALLKRASETDPIRSDPIRSETIQEEEQKDPLEPPSGSPPPPTKAKRASRLPLDWTPDPADTRRLGSELHLSPEVIQAEQAKFADYWAAAAGKGSTKMDWKAAWRGWLRRSVEFRGPVNGGRTKSGPLFACESAPLIAQMAIEARREGR